MKHDLTVLHTSPFDLTLHPDNPRIGALEELKKSLTINGQYKAVVVNTRTGHVVAGNHTVKAARELGWTDIAYHAIDVDDTAEMRILAADNRIGDLGTYDDDLLIAILTELDSLDGTGYTPADLEALKYEEPEDEPEPEDVSGPALVIYGAVIETDTLEAQRTLVARLRADGLDARPLKRE